MRGSEVKKSFCLFKRQLTVSKVKTRRLRQMSRTGTILETTDREHPVRGGANVQQLCRNMI